MVIALGAFFVQSGQLGGLNFGKINFGVPLNSLGQNPVLKYNAPKGTLGSPTASGGSQTGGSQSGGSSGGTTGVSGLPSGTGPAFTPSGVSLPPMPAGSPTARFSDFYGRIKMGTASSKQLSLKAVFQSGEKVNVTGWYFKAKNGGWYVPKAINIYDPTGLAEPGDILLGRGETVNMYSGISPVGANFRLNLCTGYLNNNRTFSPSLPRQCPGADKATLRNFSAQCQDYVPGAVGGCREPKSNPPLPYYDEGCRKYLENFSFRGCFDTYRGKPSFLKSEGRVWMGTSFLNSRHDRVFLLDKNGYLVDWKEY